MVIGLGFFIRASTKDRIETMEFGSSQSAQPLQKDVLSYFQTRAYRQVVASSSEALSDQDAEAAVAETGSSITVAGMVSPSVFMAVFLTTLAATGFACLALILTVLFPSIGAVFFGLVLVSPLAGVFYWRKSSRPEKVVFKVEPAAASARASESGLLSKLTVQGHRDELAELKSAFSPVLQAWQ